MNQHLKNKLINEDYLSYITLSGKKINIHYHLIENIFQYEYIEIEKFFNNNEFEKTIPIISELNEKYPSKSYPYCIELILAP